MMFFPVLFAILTGVNITAALMTIISFASAFSFGLAATCALLSIAFAVQSSRAADPSQAGRVG